MSTKSESVPAAGSPHLKFQAVLRLEGKTATGIQVPPEIVAGLGASRRPPVRVTLRGYTFRTTVAAYNKVYMIPVSAEIRKEAGVNAGDELEIEIEIDTQPREVEIPPDFAESLAQDAQAQHFFGGLSYSNKHRFVLSIEEAKTPETRQRRIAKALSSLHEGKI